MKFEDIQKFDMTTVQDKGTVVIIGKRSKGKSTLVKDILRRHQSIPTGTIVSCIESIDHQYTQFAPQYSIHDQYSPSIVHEFVEQQRNASLEIIEKRKRRETPSTSDSRAVLVLDNCMFDTQSWDKDKNIWALFTCARFHNTLLIFTMSYGLSIPPKLTTNTDYVFIFRENFMSNRQRLYEMYGGMFCGFEDFCSTLDRCTDEDHKCMVLNMAAAADSPMIFWYKAEPH